MVDLDEKELDEPLTEGKDEAIDEDDSDENDEDEEEEEEGEE